MELCLVMEEEATEREPWMWYMAQIAMEIAQSRSKKRLQIKDFLLDFVIKKPQAVSKELTEEEKAFRLQQSKNFWMGLVGSKSRKPPPQKKKDGTTPKPPPNTPARRRRR